MEYKKIAEEFGKRVWPVKNKINLKDILLYGSVAQDKESPNDIDLLILHKNPLLDKFHFEFMHKNMSQKDKYSTLSYLLKDQINLKEILSDKNIGNSIQNNVLHPQYMNTLFFYDNNYRKKWKKHNDFHKPHQKGNHEEFIKTVFSQGKLWNPLTEKYDVPAYLKYPLESIYLKINS